MVGRVEKLLDLAPVMGAGPSPREDLISRTWLSPED